MKFSVDAWDPSYGTSVRPGEEQSKTEAVLEVERPTAQWGPVDAAPGVQGPDTVYFVDGVRRVDAQLWIHESTSSASPAQCASYAAGVVRCSPLGAQIIVWEVARMVAGLAADGADITTPMGAYRYAQVTPTHVGQDPTAALSNAVQQSMQATEMQLTAAVQDESGEAGLVIADGAIGRNHLPGVVGLIKTHSRAFLPPTVNPIVSQLDAGQRTPVFRLENPENQTDLHRYSWYLRLSCPPGAPWAGIVRLECSGTVTPDQAVLLANLSQVTVPKYASEGYKDSRAPQNLYPIGGLERALRRRLGEPSMLYRALRRAAAVDGFVAA